MTNADGKPKRGRPKQADASRKKIELAERRQQVADYVDQGLTLTTAAKRLGISETLARRDFAEWLKEGGPTPERDEMRATFRRRYAVIAEKAALDVHVLRQAGDYDGAAKATGVILKAMDAARKLDGLDVPAKVDVTSGGEVLGSQTVLDRLAGILDKE